MTTTWPVSSEADFAWDDDEQFHVGCVACDGPLVLLGELGFTAWTRCRNCGLDQSVNPADVR